MKSNELKISLFYRAHTRTHTHSLTHTTHKHTHTHTTHWHAHTLTH